MADVGGYGILVTKDVERRPRLLVVLPAPAIGGAETTTYDLLKGLHRFDCVLLTQASIADYYRDLGIPIHQFDARGGTEPCSFARANIRCYARIIASVARREESDLILAMLHHGTLFAAAASRLFKLGIPVVGTVLGNISGYFALFGRQPSPVEQAVLRYCLSKPRVLVTPSHGVRDDLIRHYGGDLDKIKVIFNGVDIARCRSLASATLQDIRKDCPWIVSASRLCPQKDYPTLLAAFRDVLAKTPAKLVLVGEGEQREYIQRLAAELDIADQVVMLGYKQNPFPYVAQADVFVLSSFFEGFGNVIIEAMALGVPVVASNCPSGPAEIIVDGENGVLVPPKDAKLMAQSLLRLLEDQPYRRRISDAGRARAEEFGVGRMAAAFDDLFESILGEARLDSSQ